MADDCPNCGTLQAQIAQLIGGVTSTVVLIDSELDEATMNRHQLVHVIKAQLAAVLSSAY
ncbi:hypothetical protein [Micromonospora sp. NPDC023633]|uniref:hypothetical protein n=1 Tax=Micromonospora sp. NPDC023633 TaxID=3154320 RepID=UPI0034029C08